MPYLWCSLLGYLLGMLNPAFFIAKIQGIDIRERGSGNAGASNVLLVFGKLRGILCACLDIFKAFLAIRLAEWLFPGEDVFAVTAAACILGHIFPFYMKFRGGKGLACLAGVVLAYHPMVFALMLTGALLLALATGYICFVPMVGSVVFAAVYGCMTHDLWGTLMLLAVSAVIIVKHAANIRRIRAGREVRICYLWNKERETLRMKKNTPAEEWDHPEGES